MTHAVDLQADVADILLSEERIQARVTELGRQITDDYAGRRLTLVSVLKGSLPFMADLMRVIDLPCGSTSWRSRRMAGPRRSRPAS